MKKLIVVLVGIILSVGGCGWYSFCDPKSPDYDPQRCQEAVQQAQLAQLQQQQWQQQQQINRMKMQRSY